MPRSAKQKRFFILQWREETGAEIDGEFVSLGTYKQPGGKIVHAWAVAGEVDPASIKSNTFSMEWPPKSGRRQEFPEIDRAEWFAPDMAEKKILKGQIIFLYRLLKILEAE